jgi:hypothetical protein
MLLYCVSCTCCMVFFVHVVWCFLYMLLYGVSCTFCCTVFLVRAVLCFLYTLLYCVSCTCCMVFLVRVVVLCFLYMLHGVSCTCCIVFLVHVAWCFLYMLYCVSCTRCYMVFLVHVVLCFFYMLFYCFFTVSCKWHRFNEDISTVYGILSRHFSSGHSCNKGIVVHFPVISFGFAWFFFCIRFKTLNLIVSISKIVLLIYSSCIFPRQFLFIDLMKQWYPSWFGLLPASIG